MTTRAAINTALDAVAEGQLTGLDRGFGGYFDALAAEALTVLGRWAEAAGVLARHPVANTLPVGLLRLARAAGDARCPTRRHRPGARVSLPRRTPSPSTDGISPFSTPRQPTSTSLSATGTKRPRRRAGLGIDGGRRRCCGRPLRDVQRRRQPSNGHSTSAPRRQPIDLADDDRTACSNGSTPFDRSPNGPRSGPQRDTAAHLAHAAASLTRLTAPDADAWADAVARWTELGDRWMTAVARVREAEAAALRPAPRTGPPRRSDKRTRSRPNSAPRPLLTEIDAVSTPHADQHRSARPASPSTRAPPKRLGLTPREAEVLALVAAGAPTARSASELYVSDKTASVHVSNILRKLGVNSRVDAAAVAQRLGIA